MGGSDESALSALTPIERRRFLAAELPLEPRHAAQMTVSQRAVLRIIAIEMSRQGVCDLSVVEIAARAACSVGTVQGALHLARRMGLVTKEGRSLKMKRPRKGWLQLGPD